MNARRQLLRDYLLTVAGPDRSRRHNLQLAALLALNAGVLNSVGFVAVSVYTSHMTGLTAMVPTTSSSVAPPSWPWACSG